MGWIQVHENTKVPILKNIAYALKILFKCSKTFMLWQVIAMVSSMLFTNFLQSVLFLKALLSVIEGGYDFAYYAKTVLAFAGVSLLSEVIMCVSRLQWPCYSKRYFQGHEQYDFQKSIRGRHKLL